MSYDDDEDSDCFTFWQSHKDNLNKLYGLWELLVFQLQVLQWREYLALEESLWDPIGLKWTPKKASLL